MLAKVPVRGRDAKSSFAALTQYLAKDAAAITHSQEIWSVETAADEMQQVASFSRARHPVYHYVLSWREGEHPTDGQAFEAVTHTLRALGMQENQWVAAIHRNTDNVHAHVAVNRVNPETFKAVSLFRDWMALDRSCREIELQQGWTHDMGPHRIQIAYGKNPEVVRGQAKSLEDQPAAPSSRAGDFTARSGRENFHQWLADEPSRHLRMALYGQSVGWQDVHRRLAKFNLEYQCRGSGAVVVDRNEPERFHGKASHLGRFASLRKLEARLGPYEGPAGAPMVQIVRSYGQQAHERVASTVRRSALNIAELSRQYGKPVKESKLIVGWRHTGRLLAAVTERDGRGVIVIDAGPELAKIEVDAQTARAARRHVGRVVRAHAGVERDAIRNIAIPAWSVHKVDKDGRERQVGLSR